MLENCHDKYLTFFFTYYTSIIIAYQKCVVAFPQLIKKTKKRKATNLTNLSNVPLHIELRDILP